MRRVKVSCEGGCHGYGVSLRESLSKNYMVTDAEECLEFQASCQ